MKFYKGDTHLIVDLEEFVDILESDMLLDTMSSVAQIADNDLEHRPYQAYDNQATDPNSFLYPAVGADDMTPEDTLDTYMDAKTPHDNPGVTDMSDHVMAINDEDCRLMHILDSFDPQGLY